ncbi:ADP-ribosyl cyclase/cyclic ADP-ribose hydrolase 1-like isoform X1 [Xyrichtys novacula]|uniref:ADP-ribosyl cyclase/cyclic ADP-ribose hydrolase n=1 Tax=Xyrichtys novacula TaxID=13765 RepID=A0AAV1H9J8_XYRNO|nr:ADP-ribosyl cyclase/cyclic ADP-ribose hydrolase 1-like isoform X1 [Xyrichtys novacula]
MSSKKALPISGTLTVMVIVVVLVPSALLDPTAEFEAAFLKKCVEFPEDKNTCKATLAIFEEAYVGKKKTAVTEDSYNKLFDKTPFKHPCGETMLYSGIDRVKTTDVVHRFTKKTGSYFTLEDTLLGHVLDGLIWCGKEGSKETFTEHCTDTMPNPYISFWIMASVKVAQYACGHVTVMLDGEREQPYYDKSVFATHEVPNLQSPEVKNLVVILVVGQKDDTKCNKESLKNLSNILKGKKIGYACKEVTLAHIEECIKEGKGVCW